jgi:eukaryotic-like serine/threonine-protein kinase
MRDHDTADRRLLRCAAGPAEGATPSGLPAELLQKAGRRLGVAALIYAAAYVLAYTTGRVLSPGVGWPEGPFPQALDLTALVFVTVSIAVFFLARSQLLSDARLLDVGLVYMVVAALGVDQYLFWGTLPEGTRMNGISWVGVWIVSFSLVVPSTTGKVVLATLAAASTPPLLYVLGRATGAPPLGNLSQMFIANYICAGIGIVASRIVFAMGTDLGNALRMGSYQLVEKLGQGGMGEVWKAEHRMLARPAAVKLVSTRSGSSSSASSPEAQRLEREVQATAQLRSPHTVEVYDYGLTDDGRFYYVMELLDGMDLEQLVERHGPLPAERVVHVLEQVCHSLSEAHENGLVHRDIKPANIFLCRYGRDLDFVKVLDFGLVRRSGEISRGDAKLTEVGGFAGTPAYGSPESAEGNGTLVDERSDIYSLGCVAYWLLTGRTVFEAPSPMLMLVQHLHTEPERPSLSAIGHVPAALDDLVLSCLRKRPAARPASTDEIAERLRAIELDVPWSAERARAWWGHVERPVATVSA